MVKPIRAKRIADRIRQELSEMLLYEVTDPRLEGVSVTDVTVDRELAYAKVYVSALEGSERKQDILEGLLHAAGFFRYQLSQRIELRSFPQLRFKWDATAERAERIEELLSSLEKERRKRPPQELDPGDNDK
jgi:ribosome-binding factor A